MRVEESHKWKVIPVGTRNFTTGCCHICLSAAVRRRACLSAVLGVDGAHGYVLGKGRARSSCGATARKKLLHAAIALARCSPSVLLRNAKRTIAGRRARCDASLSLSAARPPRRQTMQSARTPVHFVGANRDMWSNYVPAQLSRRRKGESPDPGAGRPRAPLCVPLGGDSPSLFGALAELARAAPDGGALIGRVFVHSPDVSVPEATTETARCECSPKSGIRHSGNSQ